jgi:hypothetical protein
MTNFSFCFWLCLLLVVGPVNISAQSKRSNIQQFSKGFIIQNNGDSVPGFIYSLADKKNLVKSIYFKSNKYFESQIFYPLDISYFGNPSGTDRYISVGVPGLQGSELSFVKVLLEGLYDMFYYNLLGVNHILIRDPSNRVFDVTSPPDLYLGKTQSGEMTRDNFEQNLRTVFADNPEIIKNIDQVKATKKSLLKLLLDYYDNNGKAYKLYGVSLFDLKGGITAGITSDNLKIKEDGKYVNSEASMSPYFGFNGIVANRNSGLGIMLESVVAPKSFHYYYNTDYPLTREYNEVFLKSLVSITRMGLNYSGFSGSKLNTFVEGGGILSAFVSPKFDNYKDVLNKSDNVVVSSLKHEAKNSSLYFGAFVRAGINIDLKNNNGIRISGGYSTAIANGSEKLNSFDLAVSYLFRKNKKK